MPLVMSRSLRASLLLALALIVSLAYGHGRSALAASFTVNDTSDAVDATPGDGVCETGAGNGICTLRAAVQETNAHPGADTITLQDGTYTLSIAGNGEDAAATGDLDITDDLTINGTGRDTTIVDGGALDTVFQILSGTTVDMTAVTVRNGQGIGYAGGIGNDGTLHMSDCKISGNHTTGGTNAGGARNGGTMVLNDCFVTSNTAGANGGGIWNSGGTLTLNNSTVSGNTAVSFSGGGIGNNGGTVILHDSIVSGNTAAQKGGGIWSDTNLTAIGSSFIANTAGERGGGIYTEGTGTLTLADTVIGGNTATAFDGGGIDVDGGTATLTGGSVDSNNAGGYGGGINNEGTLTVTNSTISGNTAATGGGISDGGDATLTNVTVSGNSAPGNNVGGVYNPDGPIAIISSTITGNSSTHTGRALFRLGI